MKKLSKEEVLQIVAGWISIKWGYNAPPEVEMLEDGSVCLKEDLYKGNPDNDFIPEEGERVVLDAEFANSSEVTVVSLTPKKMFTKVRSDDGQEWETMTNRLTKLQTKLQK